MDDTRIHDLEKKVDELQTRMDSIQPKWSAIRSALATIAPLMVFTIFAMEGDRFSDTYIPFSAVFLFGGFLL